MAYVASDELFCYSNTNQNPGILAQTNPLLSIGGWAPVGQVVASSMYRAADTDAPHVGPNIIYDTQINDDISDPVTGDWYWMMTGPNAGIFGKIVADDQVAVPGFITLDRQLPDQTAVQRNFRTFKRENMFDNVDAAGAVDGYVDYRQIWFAHGNQVLNNDDWRFYIDPIKPNGCDVELVVPGEVRTTNSTFSQPFVYLPADRFEDPFGANGIIKSLAVQSNRLATHQKRGKFYSPTIPTPLRGVNDFASTEDQWLPIWLKRTVRPGTRSGECAFRLVVTVSDAVTSDPNPYFSGFIMSWFVDQPTYSIAIRQDRRAHTDSSARITATITDSRGVPVPNLNAWLELASGPGSVVSDKTLRTDAQGRISGLYISPSVTGATPVVRCVIPTNTET